MAERVGFEPTLPVKVNTLSKRAVSTTHTPLLFITSDREYWLILGI